MPALDHKFLLSLRADAKEYDNFVETGTYMGETIFAMEPFFKSLYTIEISDEYHTNTKKRYNGDKIKFILGNSSEKLMQLIPNLKGTAIFFLDGHWSGGNTGRGDKDCPLMEELNAIYNNFMNRAILIIDDVRLFGRGPNRDGYKCDWEDINVDKILKMLDNRITNKYYLPSTMNDKDRLIVHLKNIQ